VAHLRLSSNRRRISADGTPEIEPISAVAHDSTRARSVQDIIKIW
jgi:hypothetical protein